MLIAAETTLPDGVHATFNALMLQAIAQEVGPVLFASTHEHFAAVQEAARPENAPIAGFQPIAVLPPGGGVRLRRIAVQWRALEPLVRRHRPDDLVLLSTGPETLLAARALVAAHRRLRVHLIIHGNLVHAFGWRSPNPVTRAIDLRSSLRLSRHPRCTVVVLEPHIRQAVDARGVRGNVEVWPHPCPVHEQRAEEPWTPGPRIRLSWVGSAHGEKCFGLFLQLHAAFADRYDWSVTGRLRERHRFDLPPDIDVPQELRSRRDYLDRLRAADFALLLLGPGYEFSASGSLMDCIAQRKPVIALESEPLTSLVRRYGPIGYLHQDEAELRARLADPASLADPSAYALFQRSLAAIAEDRSPASLGRLIRNALASRDQNFVIPAKAGTHLTSGALSQHGFPLPRE